MPVARLDRLIQVLYEQRGDALQLAVGKPVTLLANGSARALTRDPLTDVQILALAREVADADAAARLGGGEAFSFGYRSPSGQVTVALSRDATGPLVEVRAGAPAAGAPARTSTNGPLASRERATVTCPLGER